MCLNGATYKVPPNVLRELGAGRTLIGASRTALISMTSRLYRSAACVRAGAGQGADLGIALDATGDRV